jgi:hypothetical protein
MTKLESTPEARKCWHSACCPASNTTDSRALPRRAFTKGLLVLRTRADGIFALFAFALWLSMAAPATLRAQDSPLPQVSIGGGLQTSFVHTSPEGGDGTDQFLLNSVRLYVSGSATKTIKFMFNTEYDGSGNHVTVLDAAARFEFSDRFNVWVGRFLPPSDRANLYGPYYAHHWNVYTDGVQDGYPFVATGRDNGAVYWGQFGKVKVSGGAFDGSSANNDATLITAGRVQVDFWDPEPGYYLNGTFYGDKNILAIGAAGQYQGKVKTAAGVDASDHKTAYNVDFLLERKVGHGGAYSIEAEYAKYNNLGGYDPRYGTDDGGYVLGSYLFPTPVGMGRFEVLGKFAAARFRSGVAPLDLNYNQKTTELNLNYVIKQFNARVMIFYKDTRFDAVRTNSKQAGVGLQVQI